MQLNLTLLRLAGLLCALGELRLNCQGNLDIANEVTVAPFNSATGRIEGCDSISEFSKLQKQRKQGLHSQLKQRFSTCTSKNVPYGEYRVRGKSGINSFEGTCAISNAHAVCIPVIPFDTMDWFGLANSTVLFTLDEGNVSSARFWLNIKPLFYGAWPVRGPNAPAYPSALDITTGFDDFGTTTISLPHLSQFVVTVLKGGKAVASAPLEIQQNATSHSYRLSIGTDGCLFISPGIDRLPAPSP